MDALLEAALEQPADKRESFVIQSSEDDVDLRKEVLSLLRAQSQASQFMEHSAMRVAAAALAGDLDLTISGSLVGKEIANYRIEKLLGAGGMGEVYLAHERKLNRMVALKILPWHLSADSERHDRFQREARALSSLNHPNLITIYEVGEANGLHFIAMELVEGETLSSLRQSLTLKQTLSIVGQVAEALWTAHQAGVVHRDIKTDNIMFRSDGYVKVLDFGLVKLTELAADTSRNNADTREGVAMGTLAYMSPEQAAGEPVDQRTDIWSLGVVLYELVSGKKPFKGQTRQSTINAILSADPEPVTSIDESLPSELNLILDKALEKDRDLRYQTASDFRSDIRRLLRQIDTAATASGSSPFRRSVPQFTRRAWFWPLVISAALVAAAVPLFWYYTPVKEAGPDWSRAVRLQLTNQAGTEFFPVLAPHGEDFVYASNEGGNFDLYLQRVGGKNARPLTPNTPSHDMEPAYAPDGKHIAFYSSRDPSGIYVMEATGENVRPVTPACHHPSWSPDGREIVCSTFGRDAPSTRNTKPSSLWIVDVATGAKRLLCESDAMQPAWSPNGNRIAFWFMPPSAGRSDIATISSAGGEIEVISKDASTNWNPVWSPDGKFLYFASDRLGNMSFWRVPIDEKTGKALGEPEAVVTPSTFNRHLGFSRDGRRMIYVQTDEQSNMRAVKFDPRSERTIGEPFWITRGDQRIVRPKLSPDGTRFVMRVPRRTQDDIVVMDLDGSNWCDLTNDKFFDRYPRWSPDGKKIAFTSDRSGRYEIWIIDAEGTNLRQLSFDSSGDTTFPLWSPDGTRIQFQRNHQNVIVDVNKPWSEQALQILPATEKLFVASDWSPDGTKLIGTFTDYQVVYFSFTTNQYEIVSDAGSFPIWFPDSTRYVSLSSSTLGKAYVGDITTKRVREIQSLKESDIRGLSISPDGQLLYFTLQSTESDVWLLDLK